MSRAAQLEQQRMSSADHLNEIAVIAGAGPAGLTAALELLRRSDIVPLVIMSHEGPEGFARRVAEEIESLGVVRGNVMRLRVKA